jgi:hypothetical protein
MTEYQQQKATIASLVPATLRRLDQPFNLAAGEVLSVIVVANRPPRASAFSSVHHFVESSFGAKPRKPPPNGQGLFQLST